ncbi:MAG: CPBP family intramembrane metalloprotease [Acidobacteria bacterium]|nr:CPBP family intramembrane metalloprotease [Acidobacteriota bacterium]
MSTPEDKLPPQQPAGEPARGPTHAEGTHLFGDRAAHIPEPAPSTPGEPGAAVPEDLRTTWNWPDLIIFLVFVLGSSIILPLLAGVAAVVFWHVNITDIEKVPATKAAVLVAGQALWSAATMIYLFGTVRLRQADPFWRTIGWRALRPNTMTARKAALLCLLGGVGLAVTVQLSSFAVGKKTKLPIEELFQSRSSVLLLMALGILVAPLVEETIFRGYIYPVLARGLGIPAGVLLTGTLFGLVHAPQLWGGWGQVMLIIVVGIVLTSVRARTGTVLASFLVHLGYNTMLFLEFVIATGGLRHIPGHP